MAFCHCPDKLLNYLNYFDRRYTHMQDPEQSSKPARRFCAYRLFRQLERFRLPFRV